MTDYYKKDHSHCFESDTPPCGIQGSSRHRCCLCNEAVPTPPPTLLDNEKFYNLMQNYRHTPLVEQEETVEAFKKVISFIESELKSQKKEMLEKLVYYLKGIYDPSDVKPFIRKFAEVNGLNLE